MKGRTKRNAFVLLVVASLLNLNCGASRTVRRLEKEPLQALVSTTAETVEASLELRTACQEVVVLSDELRQLVVQRGADWSVSGPLLESISSRVHGLYGRLSRLARGGVGTAVAAAVNFREVYTAISALAGLFEGEPKSLTAGELVLAVTPEASPAKPQPPRPAIAEPRAPEGLPVGGPLAFDAPEAELKALLLQLFDPSADVRAGAAAALGRTRDFRALGVLGILISDQQARVRLAAIHGLGNFADWSVVLTLGRLATCGRQSEAENMQAVESLAAHGDDNAADMLYDILENLSRTVQDRARQLLEEKFARRLAFRNALARAEKAAVDEKEGDGELAELLSQVGDASVPPRRLQAALSLARLGDPRAVPTLAGLVLSRESSLSDAAVDALRALVTPQSDWSLFDLVADGRLSLDVRKRCAGALAAHDNELAASLLLELERRHSGTLNQLGVEQLGRELIKRRLPRRTEGRDDSLVQTTTAAETELLLDLLQAPGPEQRRSTIERALTLKADVLPALVSQLGDPALAELILPALEDYSTPQARGILVDYLLERKNPQELRLVALDALAQSGKPMDAGELTALAARLQGEDLGPRLKLLFSRYRPELAKQAGFFVEERPPPDRTGVIPLAVGLGLHGGAGMVMVSLAGNPSSDELIYLPVLGGSILGVGTSLLLTWKQEEFTLPQAVYVNTCGLWALYEAGMLGLGLAGGGDNDTLLRVGLAMGFLAQAGGITFGWLTRDSLGRGWGQQMFMNTSLLMGSVAGLGSGLLEDHWDENHLYAWIAGAGLGSLVLSGALGRSLEFRGADALQTTNSMLLGGALGFAIATAATSDPGDSQVLGSMLLGTALGYGTGSLLSAYTDPRPLDLLALDGVLIAGSVAGLGAAWQKDDTSYREDSLWMLGGSALAALAGGLSASHIDFGPGGAWFSASLSLMGGWTGYLLAGAIQPEAERAAWGGMMLGVPLGLSTGIALAALSEPSSTRTTMTDLSFLAGNIAGLGAVLQTDSPGERDYYLWLLGGGTAAALAGGLLTGNRLELSGPDALETAAATALGAWSGYWALRIFRPDHPDADWGGLALGAALGFGVGATTAAFTEPSYGEIAHATVGFGVGSAFGVGLGLSIEGLSDPYTYGIMLGTGLAGVATAVATESITDFSTNDAVLISFGAGWGLYQGMATRAAAGVRGAWDDKLSWGSAVLGLTGGALAAGVLSQFTEIPPSVVGRAGVGGLFGSLIGGGLGLMIPELEEEGPWALALSGGWAGLGVYAFAVPPADYTTGDWLALGLGGGWGVWQGYLLGSAAGLEGNRLYGALGLGLSLGLVAGDIFARAGDLSIGEVVFTELSSYAGSGLGVGGALLSESAGTTAIGIAGALGGWGLKTATGFFADRMKFRADDVFEYLFFQGYGSWQGVGFSLLSDVSDRELQGGALIGLSAGFLLPMLTNQLQDFSFVDDLFIAGGTALGSWIGGWGAWSLFSSNDAVLLGALLGGDVGLLASGLLLSDLVGVSRWKTGWTELTAVGGLGLGASMTAIFTRDSNILAGGIALGTVLGTVAGVIWTSFIDEPKKEDRPPEPAAEASSGEKSALAPGAARHGGIGDIPAWLMPTVFFLPPPQSRPDAPPALMVALQGVLDL